MIDLIQQPWPWYVAGPLLSLIMFSLLFAGKNFGMSSNLRTMCSISGGGKFSDFFRFNWKEQTWNLMVVLGAMIGGFFAANFLSAADSVDISEQTKAALTSAQFENPGEAYLPAKLYGLEALTSVKGILLLIIGGLLIGFGSRYAGGCTSGHAISGLSNLQIPSLIAVIGFFIGGLIMTHLLFPILF